MYHPDKHLDIENKQNAENLFGRIKKAHESILSYYKLFEHVTCNIIWFSFANFLCSLFFCGFPVLSDPAKRAIYDTVGLAALETHSQELVLRYQTPQEIRDTYERLQREKAEREVERKTNPKGMVTVSVNATELFNPYVQQDDPYYLDSEWIHRIRYFMCAENNFFLIF